MTMPAVVQTLGAGLPLVMIILLKLVARWPAAWAVGLGVTLACGCDE